MPLWLWPLLAVAAVLVLLLLALLRPPRPVVADFPNGIRLAGTVRRGRATYFLIQWHAAPTDPSGAKGCPLTVHLPSGDLGGEALCAFEAEVTALQLGGPRDLVINPIFAAEKMLGVSVGLIPGTPPVAVSLRGWRFTLPLSEDEAVRQLGEPSRRSGMAAQTAN